MRISLALMLLAAVMLSCSGQETATTDAAAPSTPGASAEPNNPPSVGALEPSSGSGRVASLTAVFSDPNGAENIEWAQVLVNNELNGAGACYVHWVRESNAMYLKNDQDTGLIGPIAAGTPGKLENAQCSVDTAASTATASGDEITLKLAMTFKGGFNGQKKIFLRAQDYAGVVLDWADRGTWSVQ